MIQKSNRIVIENFLIISELNVHCKILENQLNVCFVNPNSGNLFCRTYVITNEQKESFNNVDNLKQFILSIDKLDTFVENAKRVFNSSEEME